MSHADQFTATGPAFVGSGVPRAGFSTERVEDRHQDFVDGANVQGQRCGVYADSVAARGDVADRESSHEGVGVHGVGDNFGVFGDGNPGIAGIFGRHNRGGAGVVGAVMRGGTGVIGVSMSSLGNEVANFRPLPTGADGEGTGVLGSSGTGAGLHGTSNGGDGVLGSSSAGAGVHGTSNEADGILGSSDTGVGVHGTSIAGAGVRGSGDAQPGVEGSSSGGPGIAGASDAGVGVVGHSTQAAGGSFSSSALAQLHLEPHPNLADPNGSIPGEKGDLIALSAPRGNLIAPRRQQVVATLWFCRIAGNQANAVWAQVA